MILITGAHGKTGKALLRQLTGSKIAVRALVHRADQKEEMQAQGAADVVSGDLLDRHICLEASEGVETIYHIPPNMYKQELEAGRTLLAAAREQKVSSFIFHSVLHPHIAQMQHHWNKLLVEQEIFTSGLDYAIVQPTVYMQNILGYWSRIISQGIYAPPYSPQTRLGLVDLNDVAEAAAKIILQPVYRGGIFELVGTPPHSQEEIAAIISQHIGRTVKAEAQSRQEWEEIARKNRVDEYAIQTLKAMFIYYEDFGMWGSSHALQSILGRSPRSFDQFIARVVEEQKDQSQR